MSGATGGAGRAVDAAELRRALDDAEFFPVFQGVYDATAGILLGVEALARWRGPDGRLVLPDVFIPAAEESGLIGQVSRQIWGPAARAVAARWPGSGALQPWLSINVSPVQVLGTSLVGEVQRLAADAGLVPERLVLELTEGVLVAPESIEVLTALRELGFRVAIDDFGKGWSSLSRLNSLPLDILKVDRDFVVDLGLSRGGNAHAILRAVVALGRAVGAVTVIEGVEQAWQCSDVKRLGGDAVQGYYLGRPGPLQEVSAVVRGAPEEDGSASRRAASARLLRDTAL